MNAKKAKRLKKLLKDAPTGTYRQTKRAYAEMSAAGKRTLFQLIESVHSQKQKKV